MLSSISYHFIAMALHALANPDSLSSICDTRCVFDSDDSPHEDCAHSEAPTDALLTQLHLQRNIPPRYIDAFLTLMQHKHIELETDPESDSVMNLADRDRKRAIALFIIAIKSLDREEGLQVRDIWDRNNTDGFVKVSQGSRPFSRAIR